MADALTGVAVFLTVARTGSFTLAAKELRVTKSAVSKSIARLEDRLGCELIHRTTRQMRLTDEGAAYHRACAAAYDTMIAAESALSTDHQALSGRLHIAAPASFGRRILLPILAEVIQQHPDISLQLSFSEGASDLLNDGVDLAIRFGTLPDTHHLVARHLARQRRVICGSPMYLDLHGTPKTLRDLRLHRCVVGSIDGPPTIWTVCGGGKDRRITPNATHQVSDGEAVVDAAVAGLGLIQMPMFMVREKIADGRLIPILMDHSTACVDVAALWPRQSSLNPKVRFVVDHLVASALAGRLD